MRCSLADARPARQRCQRAAKQRPTLGKGQSVKRLFASAAIVAIAAIGLAGPASAGNNQGQNGNNQGQDQGKPQISAYWFEMNPSIDGVLTVRGTGFRSNRALTITATVNVGNLDNFQQSGVIKTDENGAFDAHGDGVANYYQVVVPCQFAFNQTVHWTVSDGVKTATTDAGPIAAGCQSNIPVG